MSRSNSKTRGERVCHGRPAAKRIAAVLAVVFALCLMPVCHLFYSLYSVYLRSQKRNQEYASLLQRLQWADQGYRNVSRAPVLNGLGKLVAGICAFNLVLRFCRCLC